MNNIYEVILGLYVVHPIYGQKSSINMFLRPQASLFILLFYDGQFYQSQHFHLAISKPTNATIYKISFQIQVYHCPRENASRTRGAKLRSFLTGPGDRGPVNFTGPGNFFTGPTTFSLALGLGPAAKVAHC